MYIDEAHVHQDADMGYGWSARGERLWVCSSSPGLQARVSFYGLYLFNEGQVRIWDFERANGEHTVAVLERLRREHPGRAIRVVWDGAGYHRGASVREAAERLQIALEPLNADPIALSDRLWVKDSLDPEEEKLRMPR